MPGNTRLRLARGTVFGTGSCRRYSGSATVELVFVVPFVLIILAAVWDLREYIAYRTELAREMYVVAEVIADHPEGSAPPFERAIGSAVDRLREQSRSGVIRGAAVVRGTQRPDGSACPADEWCLPMVSAVWPAADNTTAGRWSSTSDNACADLGNSLPALDGHFTLEHKKVLPNEGADPDGDGPEVAPAEKDWISRSLSDTEWWVIVDTCVDPEPGLFIGKMTNLAARMFDTSFVLRRRAVWGSIHDRTDCEWCG